MKISNITYITYIYILSARLIHYIHILTYQHDNRLRWEIDITVFQVLMCKLHKIKLFFKFYKITI